MRLLLLAALLPLLILLLVALQLLQLLLQLFGFAPQHFLLVALGVCQLLLVAQVVGELFLALRQLIQFLHDVFRFLLLLLRADTIAGFVLVEREVHFQLEHLGKILAGAAAATTTTTALLLRNGDVVEH